jgi:hypothetical protein
VHSITQICKVINGVLSKVRSFFGDVALQLLVEKQKHSERCIPNYLLPLRVILVNVEKAIVDRSSFKVVVAAGGLGVVQLLADRVCKRIHGLVHCVYQLATVK